MVEKLIFPSQRNIAFGGEIQPEIPCFLSQGIASRFLSRLMRCFLGGKEYETEHQYDYAKHRQQGSSENLCYEI
jgi:hypothetical protein